MNKFFSRKCFINKLLITSLLLMSASSLVNLSYAKNNMSDRNGPPPRPSFDSLDLNQDGDIDFDEFSSQEVHQGDHQTIFDAIDTDNNGVLSNDEFTNHTPPQPQKRKGQ